VTIGRLFTMGSFYKITEVAQILWLLFAIVKVMQLLIWAKNV
jgi:hypothetical protein